MRSSSAVGEFEEGAQKFSLCFAMARYGNGIDLGKECKAVDSNKCVDHLLYKCHRINV